MHCMRKVCIGLVVASAALTVAVPAALANIQPVPELLVRLWPFFRSHRPVPLLPESSQPSEERRPLVAPYRPRKLDINSASFSELQNLPGISSSMAARIFAGRPYRNLDDLRRDDIPLNVVQGLESQVIFGP